MRDALFNFLAVSVFFAMCVAMPISIWLSRREDRQIDRERAKRDEEYRLQQIERDRAWDKRKREFDTWLARHG